MRYGLTAEQFERFYATIVVETLDEAAARSASDEQGGKGVAELREIFAKAEKLGFAEQLEVRLDAGARARLLHRARSSRRARRRESGFGSFGGGGRYDDLDRALRRTAAGRGGVLVRRSSG